MFITYRNVRISAETLDRLKRAMDEAEKEEKYYRYKVWLHYANLDMWQRQGHHFFYASGAEGSYCTCGLIAGKKATKGAIRASSIDERVAQSLADLNLKPIYLVTDHVNLPSLRGRTVALIVDVTWHEDLWEYLLDVICQKCAGFELQILQGDAHAFVKSHNARCKGRGA